MALTGEVTLAAARSAAWWLERTDEECAAFAGAAARSTRPDAEAWRAIATSLPWLRQLHHETIRPPVRRDAGAVDSRDRSARAAARSRTSRRAWPSAASAWRAPRLDAYHAAWRRPDPEATARLSDWLEREAPPLLVTAGDGEIVWDPDAPAALDATAWRSWDRRTEWPSARSMPISRVVDRHTRAFLAAVVDPGALPAPQANTFQRGYTYLHAARRLIAYNLHEPGMERLHGPPLPYAREMVGARTAHEWAHLADAAGWVPRTVSRDEYRALREALAAELDATIAAAPAAVRRLTASDLGELAQQGAGAGAALARLTTTRMPD